MFLRATMAAGEIFLHHGWSSVDALDVDLAGWAGKARGYGLYRTYTMVREVEERLVAEGGKTTHFQPLAQYHKYFSK